MGVAKKSRELIRMLSSSTLEGADIPGTVFENYIKSLIKHCERGELRFHFEWTKVH